MVNKVDLEIEPIEFSNGFSLSNLEMSSKAGLINHMIAGPCAAESEEQVMETALSLKKLGFKMIRAGVWKPRTLPGSFEGYGEKALKWLTKVQEDLGLLVSCEVATAEHVKLALDYGVDLLWIGARTSTNPFAVEEVGKGLEGSNIPVLVKNPMNPDLNLWLGALKRLNMHGVKRLGAIHRGFGSSSPGVYRNSPCWNIPLALKQLYNSLPIVCDPSHMGGKREYVPTLLQTSLDLGVYSGFIVESHCDPDNALTDKNQQVTPENLDYIVKLLGPRKQVANVNSSLEVYRAEIDELDDELLNVIAKRMKVSEKIGDLKKSIGMQVYQNDRYLEVLNKMTIYGGLLGLDTNFIQEIFKEIHNESVKQQIKNK